MKKYEKPQVENLTIRKTECNGPKGKDEQGIPKKPGDPHDGSPTYRSDGTLVIPF